MIYVMGTGSRSMVLEDSAKEIYLILEKRILELLEEHGEITLITGMAEGWDEAIAKVGLRNSIPYFAYVPHPTYGDYYWGRKSLTGKNRMATFNKLLNGATDVTIVAQDLYVSGQHVNFVRNQWMVNACDLALVYNPQSKGTRDAVARLRQANKPYEIYPFANQAVLF